MEKSGDLAELKTLIAAMPGNAGLKRLVLEKIRLATGAAGAQIFSQDHDLTGGDCELDIGLDPSRVEILRRGAATRNVLFAEGRSRGLLRPGTVLLSHEHIADDELERAEIYREVLHPFLFLMAVSVARYGTWSKSVSVQRERRQGPFGPTERRILRELGSRLVAAEHDEHKGRVTKLVSDAKAEVFYTQSQAVILVDQDTRVLEASRAAEILLQRRDRLLSIRRGALRAAARTAVRLADVVRAVTSTGAAQSVTLRGRSGEPTVTIDLRLVVDPMEPGCSLLPVVALYVTEHDGSRDGPARPRGGPLDELSLRQREVARLLVSTGMAYKEIAAALALREGTVRTHVERIYRVLDVHSRAELAALLR